MYKNIEINFNKEKKYYIQYFICEIKREVEYTKSIINQHFRIINNIYSEIEFWAHENSEYLCCDDCFDQRLNLEIEEHLPLYLGDIKIIWDDFHEEAKNEIFTEIRNKWTNFIDLDFNYQKKYIKPIPEMKKISKTFY